MVKYSSTLFIAAAAALAGNANAVSLTEENFNEMTSGKTVFLKFFAPWCGHCKAIAPAWQKLMDDFKDHDIALVGEVDCTAPEADVICEDFKIEGFPTLLWGDVNGAQNYNGGRDYASLKAFADAEVTKPVCSIYQIDSCSEEEKKIIASVEKMDDATIMSKAEAVAKLAKDEEKKYEDALDKLQDEFDRMTEEYNKKVEAVKEENNFKVVQQVIKKRNLKVKGLNPDEDDDDDLDDKDEDDDDLKGGEL